MNNDRHMFGKNDFHLVYANDSVLSKNFADQKKNIFLIRQRNVMS